MVCTGVDLCEACEGCLVKRGRNGRDGRDGSGIVVRVMIIFDARSRGGEG
jgi:hypothetical protein